MNARRIVRGLVAVMALAGVCASSAQAQWSIGAPGNRQAPAGKQRYVFLVYANPMAGHEVEFNEWYSDVHIGDLVQLPNWVGAQRFRIVPTVTPRPTPAGYQHGYLIIWEIEESDINASTQRMVQAIGGKSRRGAAFDYTPGAAAAGMYEVMGPRITRPDGKGPTIPDRNDPKATRPDRFMLMDFSNPAPGREAEFDATMDQRIREVLGLPGWMAAQRFRVASSSKIGGNSPKPRYLTVWEIEGPVQAAHDTLAAATKAGKVKAVAIDEKTADIVYWKPITPYVTKEDFER